MVVSLDSFFLSTSFVIANNETHSFSKNTIIKNCLFSDCGQAVSISGTILALIYYTAFSNCNGASDGSPIYASCQKLVIHCSAAVNCLTSGKGSVLYWDSYQSSHLELISNCFACNGDLSNSAGSLYLNNGVQCTSYNNNSFCKANYISTYFMDMCVLSTQKYDIHAENEADMGELVIYDDATVTVLEVVYVKNNNGPQSSYSLMSFARSFCEFTKTIIDSNFGSGSLLAGTYYMSDCYVQDTFNGMPVSLINTNNMVKRLPRYNFRTICDIDAEKCSSQKKGKHSLLNSMFLISTISNY